MSNNGFVSLVNNPTRITKNTSSCVDHIFVKHRNIEAFKSAIFDINLTDHCLLGLTLQHGTKFATNDSNVNSNISRKYNYELIRQELHSVDWSDVYNCNDVNIAYDNFYEMLDNVVSRNVRLESNKMNKAKSKSPWITINILNRISKRSKLYVKSKKRPYDLRFRQYYENFCNKLRNDIDTAKNEYYTKLISNCNNDTGQQWRIVNKLTGVVTNKSIDKVVLENGTKVEDPQEIAEEINTHLISVQESGDGDVASGGGGATHAGRLASFFVMDTDQADVLTIIIDLKICWI